MAPDLSPPHPYNIYTYVPPAQLLVCTECHHAVVPRLLVRHHHEKHPSLGVSHGSTVPRKGLHPLAQWLASFEPPLSSREFDGPATAVDDWFTPLIPFSSGYLCTSDGCFYAHQKLDPFKKHYRYHSPAVVSPTWQEHHVWQPGGVNKPYHAVDVPVESLPPSDTVSVPPVPPSPPGSLLAETIERFRQLHQHDRQAFSRGEETTLIRTMWLDRVQWHLQLPRSEVPHLIYATSCDTLPSDCFEASEVYAAVLAAVRDWNRRLCPEQLSPGECVVGTLVRRSLYDVSLDHTTGHPLQPLRSPSTLDRYARTWARCLLLLLRRASCSAPVPPALAHLPLNPSQQQACHDLIACFPRSPTGPFQPSSSSWQLDSSDHASPEEVDIFDGAESDSLDTLVDELTEPVELDTSTADASPAPDRATSPSTAAPPRSGPPETGPSEAVARSAVLALSRALLEQRLHSSEWDHPLTWYLGVSAFQLFESQEHTWRLPHQHSPTLSHVVYVLRLVALGHLLAEEVSSPHSESSFISRAREYCSRYLVHASSYIFDEVFNLRSFALEYARNWYRHPAIQWTSPDVLRCGRGELQITRLPGFAQSLVAQTEELLLALLGQSDPSYLEQFEPRRLMDNMTWANHGDSLVSLNPSLQECVPALLQSLAHRPSSRQPRWVCLQTIPASQQQQGMLHDVPFLPSPRRALTLLPSGPRL
jgi:hypothetical protein